jgi:hypothetical protein
MIRSFRWWLSERLHQFADAIEPKCPEISATELNSIIRQACFDGEAFDVIVEHNALLKNLSKGKS